LTTGAGAKVCTGAAVVTGAVSLSPGATITSIKNAKAAIAKASAYFGLMVIPFLGSGVGAGGGSNNTSFILYIPLLFVICF
jgi:hypothetical protein